MAVCGLVRGRTDVGADRQRGAVVHGPGGHAGDEDPARPLVRRALALARRYRGVCRHRAAGGDADALPDIQPGHCGAVHRPDPLAVALARGAPELGVLSERFRRPHFQPRHADRPVGALDADRDHHHGLVHFGIRRLGDRAGGRRGPLARVAAGAVVLRLRGAARLFRAAHARAFEGFFDRALDADGAHRRQLHQHPHRQAVRPRARRGRICA